MTYPVIDWTGLYGEGWDTDIVPEAYSHPAKYSRALIRHIYQYLLDNRLIQRGARILDPFGGVALGALDAQLQGLHWTGCELEPKFVTLGNANLALWQSKYASHFPRWGSARLIQGDSRRIGEVIAGASGIVSSPPYAESLQGDNGAEATRKRIAEGKYNGLRPDVFTSEGQNSKDTFGGGYSSDPNNLGNLKGDDYNAVIASPPFIQTSGGTNVTSIEGPLSDASLISRHSAGNAAMEAYGAEDGQLQNMPEGDVQAVVSSPPYEGTDLGGGAGILARDEQMRKSHGMTVEDGNYSQSNDNLGNAMGDSFWSASYQIVSQCYTLLAPGGIAVWVCKDYVRNKKRVPFSDQWQMLCEKCGFITLTEVHAWVVEDNGVQLGMMDTDDKHHRTERKSFFRRLAEKKGSPRIDWETVWIMKKSIDNGMQK